jgi:serine protease Do
VKSGYMKSILHSAILAAHVAALGALLPANVGAQVTQTLPSFVEIYETQGPAVVSIKVASVAKAGAGGNRRFNIPDGIDPDDLPEPFRRFFQQPPNGNGGNGGNGGGRGGQPEQRDRGPQQRGSGSGFIVAQDGFVVTNHHVIDGADEITVITTDKREFKAKVVGSDQRTDTALLKIDATGLTAVKIGDPAKLKVGEWIVAIGQPFGLENTLTKGVVSAKGRSNVGDRDSLASFIQHDAAVNPGNSGGPLFNLKGEVVGVNSMIYTRSGGFQGLSFAVPIDQAMDVVKQLQATGKIQRGRLGVGIGPLSKDAAEAFGLTKAQGALVSNVEKDSAAEKAGVKDRDIILKFDGKPVNESSDLPRLVTAVRPGVKVPLEVWRDGKLMALNVVVGEFKEEALKTASTSKAPAMPEKSKARLERMDIAVAELDADDKKETGAKNGVRIEDIKGRVRDLENGDIISAVIYKGITTEISNKAELDKALKKVEKGSAVSFQVRRKLGSAWGTLFLTERLSD